MEREKGNYGSMKKGLADFGDFLQLQARKLLEQLDKGWLFLKKSKQIWGLWGGGGGGRDGVLRFGVFRVE